MASLIFSKKVLHGKHVILPGVPYGFEDADAAPFFIAAGWASASDDEPLHTFSLGEIDIDPNTVRGTGPNKGAPVIVHDSVMGSAS